MDKPRFFPLISYSTRLGTAKSEWRAIMMARYIRDDCWDIEDDTFVDPWALALIKWNLIYEAAVVDRPVWC